MTKNNIDHLRICSPNFHHVPQFVPLSTACKSLIVFVFPNSGWLRWADAVHCRCGGCQYVNETQRSVSLSFPLTRQRLIVDERTSQSLSKIRLWVHSRFSFFLFLECLHWSYPLKVFPGGTQVGPFWEKVSYWIKKVLKCVVWCLNSAEEGVHVFDEWNQRLSPFRPTADLSSCGILGNQSECLMRICRQETWNWVAGAWLLAAGALLAPPSASL